jgi:hypothetical protein
MVIISEEETMEDERWFQEDVSPRGCPKRKW